MLSSLAHKFTLRPRPLVNTPGAGLMVFAGPPEGKYTRRRARGTE